MFYNSDNTKNVPLWHKLEKVHKDTGYVLQSNELLNLPELAPGKRCIT